ncbi:MAG: nicotinate-nucleotide adenylyltransferase [Betaproteobacteria bacterium]|nr:nicotinate-nucleotide adenylyltransferase [Betaproteobacteria bacterium]
MNAANQNVIGILGGTFDPVHLGHVALAEAALAGLPLSEVLWLPSGSPGHRASTVAGARDRLAMLRLATEGRARFRIDESELDRSEPTYTVHTLARLRAQLGNAQPLVLLLGSDSFLSLPTWLRWRELFDLAHIAHVSRPGLRASDGGPRPELSAEIARRSARGEQLGASAAGRIARFDMPPMDVSASAIRARLAAGQDTRHLLPAAVLAYIQSQHLYLKETL